MRHSLGFKSTAKGNDSMTPIDRSSLKTVGHRALAQAVTGRRLDCDIRDDCSLSFGPSGQWHNLHYWNLPVVEIVGNDDRRSDLTGLGTTSRVQVYVYNGPSEQNSVHSGHSRTASSSQSVLSISSSSNSA